MTDLTLLGYKYKLDMSRPLSDMNGNVGFCNFDRKYLQIANDLEKDQQESIFIHEIIEAINYHLELNLEHPQIMGLEVGLHQVLSDNGVDLGVLFTRSDNGDNGEHSGALFFKVKDST